MSRLYLLFAVDAEAYDPIVAAITNIFFVLSAILMLKSDGALVGGDSNNQLGRCMQPAHNGPPSTITCMHYLTLHYITLHYITLHYMYAASAQWPAEYQTCAQTHGNARRCPLKYQPVFVTGAKP